VAELAADGRSSKAADSGRRRGRGGRRGDRRSRGAKHRLFGREQDKLVDGDHAAVMSGGPALDGANLVGESKPGAVAHSLPDLVWIDPRTKVLDEGARPAQPVAPPQVEYCRNFIFKRHFPIHKLFERGCELGLWRLGADKIAAIFGTRLNRRMRGKLATVIDQVEHGHHVFRAYFKSGFLKQHEKVSTFLRNELVSNNLKDFRLRK
jgi:hypothetical protein